MKVNVNAHFLSRLNVLLSKKSIALLMLFMTILLLSGCAGSINYRKGEKMEKRKNVDRAVECYTKALKASPDNVMDKMHYRRALISASQEHYAKGLALYEQGQDSRQMLEAAVAEFQIAINYDATNQMAAVEMHNAIKKLKELQEKDRLEKSTLLKMKEDVEKKYPLINILRPS